jgi:hypothetical protein
MLAELRKAGDAWKARVGSGDNKGAAATKVVAAPTKPEKQLPGWGGADALAGLMVHRAVMDFDALDTFERVDGFYEASLNLTWSIGVGVFNATTTSYYGIGTTVAPPPSAPNFVFVEGAYAILTAGAGVPGGRGLVGGVDFWYSSPTKMDGYYDWDGGPFTPAKVAAWTGPAGPEGDSEKLAEVELPWYVVSFFFLYFVTRRGRAGEGVVAREYGGGR